MEISADNNANGIKREIKVKGQKVDTVTSLKYIGAVVSDDVSRILDWQLQLYKAEADLE